MFPLYVYCQKAAIFQFSHIVSTCCSSIRALDSESGRCEFESHHRFVLTNFFYKTHSTSIGSFFHRYAFTPYGPKVPLFLLNSQLV